MNKEFVVTHDQKNFYEQVEKLTDRELLELQAFYANQNRNNTENIKNNLKFFFYLTIISMAIGIIIAVNM